MPNHIPLPPLERLNELFEVVPIDPSQFKVKSGLIRKKDRGGQKKGSIAGFLKSDSNHPGRLDWQVSVDGKSYYTARLIYYMITKVDPGEAQIDHKDKNPMNNNVLNLRLSTLSLQGHNQGLQSNNKSGAIGVSWHKETNKWVARLWHENKGLYLGLHTCKITAAKTINNKIIELELHKIGKPLNNLEILECRCKCCFTKKI